MKRFSNILFVTEFNVDDTRALTQAIKLAENNQARFTMVGAVDLGYSLTNRRHRESIVCDYEERLAALTAMAGQRIGHIESQLLIGKPFIEIIREVLRNDRDLIVKSLAHRGLVTVGGTDKKLLRKSPCPVWIINPAEEHGYRKILLALDYEPDNPESAPLNRQLVEMAASLALSEFAELHIVHAWRLEHEAFFRSARSGLTRKEVDLMLADEENRRRSWLEQLTNDFCRPLGVDAADVFKPSFHLIQGHAEDVVPKFASELDAQLVVMGTVGRTGIPGFVIGNTAESILNSIDCSVMAVKPSGFKSPVTLDDSN